MTTLAVMLLLATAQASAQSSTAWPITYAGKSTNQFIWDKRAAPLISTRLPAKISRLVLEGLGGPPEPVLVAEDRYVSVSACVAHYCPWKGFFWLDTVTGIGLGAVFNTDPAEPNTLQMGSNAIAAAHIPVAARTALIDWLTEEGLEPRVVKFVGSRGDWQPLDAPAFQPRRGFEPGPGGPAFDCDRASGTIERTTCGNAELSLTDLAMARLVEEIRHGQATTAARSELLEMQHNWTVRRNAKCEAAADAVACLRAEYAAQTVTLEHWLPKR